MTIPGRVEAQCTVPAGITVQAATIGQSSVITRTITAGDYYPTAAGGVPGLLAELQAQLNDNVHGYPTTAALMNAAVGWGTWTAAYFCDELAGNMLAKYGAPLLTPAGSISHPAGFLGGADIAMRFAAGNNYFDGAGNFNITGTLDLAIAAVFYWSGNATPNATLLSKVSASFADGWALHTPSATELRFSARQAAGTQRNATLTVPGVGWYALLAVIDRSTGYVRFGIQDLVTGAQTSGDSPFVGSENYTTAATFRFGASAWTSTATSNIDTAFFALASGVGAATGIDANFPTALSNFAKTVSGRWSCALSPTTGRVSIGYSPTPPGVPSFSLRFVYPQLRDLLGFEQDLNYPASPSEMARITGFGQWNCGYSCDAASGNLFTQWSAGGVGIPATLTASGTPVYNILGPRGGVDKAIAFDAASEYFDGGDVLNVSATDDLAVLWVGRFTGLPSDFGALFSRETGFLSAGWAIYQNTIPALNIANYTSGGQASIDASGFHIGAWHVGCAVIDRSTGKLRIGTRSLSTGLEVLSTEGTSTGSAAVASTFRLGASAGGVSAATNFQCAAFTVAFGPGACAGMSANLSAVLASYAQSLSTWTGTKSALGVWCPDAAMDVGESDPRRAPRVTDLRTTQSPTGKVIGLVGTGFYRHQSVTWPLVPENRVWEKAADVPGGSWESFVKQTQFREGSDWFGVSSPIQIYDHNGNRVGQDKDVSGWQITGLSSIEPKRYQNFTGLWQVVLPEIVSNG